MRAVRRTHLAGRGPPSPRKRRSPHSGPRTRRPVRSEPLGRARVSRVQGPHRNGLTGRARRYPCTVRPSLKNITKRTAEKARETAAGSAPPAGQEPLPEEEEATAPAPERGAMRKRIRRLTHLREAQLRELGALVVELRRLGRENRELVERRAAIALATDEEL